MQDVPLSIGRLLEHVASVYPDTEVVTATEESTRRRTYAEVAERAGRLANALRGLGVDADQRVATFMWNNVEHLEAYAAVPSMGAVLHTLNIRLFPEQLTYIANHAEDHVVIVDACLLAPFAKLLPSFDTVQHVLVAGPEAADADLSAIEATGRTAARYEDLLAAEDSAFAWPDVDERDAAAMCYTSGTTGNPKGVVYSHRSAYLHSMGVAMGDAIGITPFDVVMPIVPMFHANAWGLPYAAMMVGASLVMPDRWLQAAPLVRLIEDERVTISGAVPTIWNDILGYADQHEADLSSIRLVPCGGSAVPRSLMQALLERHGVRVLQAWGMTETSPVASIALPPAGAHGDAEWDYRATQGRVGSSVQARIVGDDGQVLPRDGVSVGELEVRGPWVTAGYYNPDDPEAEQKFHDGWLRTGDVGTLDRLGYITLTDRAKDVIKSGGEWISSVELENALMSHPDVVEAAVVGIPDEKWQERPLATVVLREGATTTPEELRDHLATSFAKWQLPDAWAFVDQVPRTSVGKFDKKVVRRGFAEGAYDVRRASD